MVQAASTTVKTVPGLLIRTEASSSSLTTKASIRMYLFIGNLESLYYAGTTRGIFRVPKTHFLSKFKCKTFLVIMMLYKRNHYFISNLPVDDETEVISQSFVHLAITNSISSSSDFIAFMIPRYQCGPIFYDQVVIRYDLVGVNLFELNERRTERPLKISEYIIQTPTD